MRDSTTIYSIEDFQDKCDSLYRLVIAAARRATQIAKPDSRPLVHCPSRKPTVVALEEIRQGKVECRNGSKEEEFVE